ncbi:MAG TPA: hypothetical protein VF910_08495 [Candidatus Bathyarchaeia archaeon]
MMSEILREKIGTILAIMGLSLFFASMGIVFVPILASLFVVLLVLDGGLMFLALGAVVVAEMRERFDL